MKLALCLTLLFAAVVNVLALDLEYFKDLNGSVKKERLWGVLVAGSDGWYNYRHQADICHSYQVLHSHGISDERIIVMMKDDLAKNEANPTPGIVINHPNGKDVYHGVPHDYIGDDVTPENFMAVLKGDKKALKGKGSGKVLGSGPNDHVFVYFADHGAPGIIAFPDSELNATDLNKTIAYMHTNKKYKKMVIYIEACESGSMFDDILPSDINVFATTAANSNESSYACYFDEKRETYLGDVYSVKWMEDSDKENLNKETLTKQFKIVKKETNTSHVQEFGDLTMGKMHVSEFQGKKQTVPIEYPKVPYDAVRSRDVPLEIVKRKMQKAQTYVEMQKWSKTLKKMIRNRKFMSDKVEALIELLSEKYENLPSLWEKHLKLKNYQCYNEVREHFQKECFKISKNTYAMDFMYMLVNLCEFGVNEETQMLAMEKVCTHPPVYGIV